MVTCLYSITEFTKTLADTDDTINITSNQNLAFCDEAETTCDPTTDVDFVMQFNTATNVVYQLNAQVDLEKLE